MSPEHVQLVLTPDDCICKVLKARFLCTCNEDISVCVYSWPFSGMDGFLSAAWTLEVSQYCIPSHNIPIQTLSSQGLQSSKYTVLYTLQGLD